MTFLYKRKGSSIAEMIIVIAVLSIISTFVVSFIVVANGKVRASNEKASALSDIAAIESLVDHWVTEKTNEGYTLSTVSGGNYKNLRATNETGEEKIVLKFVDGKLISAEDNVLYTSKVVSKLNFIVSKRQLADGNEDWLVICQLTYKIRKSKIETVAYEYAFAVANYNNLVVDGAH